MRGQRSAAGLAGGDNDFAAILLQDAHGSFVQARERDIRDTPGEKRHAIPPLAFRGERLADPAEEERRLGGGRQLGDIA